jgi:RNA polymerase sigma-70 factor, ECF subfamily
MTTSLIAVDLAPYPRQSRLMAPVSRAGASPSDRELVIAAQGGDRDAFGLLYERYGRMVHGVLLARVPHDTVDDLLQDVFLLAL